jgi:hypothetical protein
MIEITVNDRLGKKVRVKCNEDDTIGDLKKLIAAQTGTRLDCSTFTSTSSANSWFQMGQNCVEEMVYNI